MKANSAFEQATELNPQNPRIEYLQGMNTLNTPKVFGGGAEAACKQFNAASEKFRTFAPENSLSPIWGKKGNEKMVKKNCDKGKS